jgi:hypothetical protein
MSKFFVESNFIYEGLRCVVVFQSMGHRCGYVGIPKTHPLYGVSYGDQSPILMMQNIADENIGERGILPIVCFAFNENKEHMTPDTYFNVHGGITYSGEGNYPIESNLWWYGFDCAHYNDEPDYDKVLEYNLEDEDKIRQLILIHHAYPISGRSHKTQEYVEQECRNLAKQLKKIVNKK